MHFHRIRATIHAGGRLPFGWLEVSIEADLDEKNRRRQGRDVMDLDAAAEVTIQAPEKPIPIQLPRTVASQRQWLISPKDGHVQISGLKIPISREQLDYIEQMRESDISVEISFWGRLLVKETNDATPRVEDVYGKTSMRVPQSEWVHQILETIGYATYDVLEMRLDHIEVHPSLSRASAHLQDALKSYHSGRVQEPIGDVRQALEAIEKALNESGPMDEYAKRVLSKGRHAAGRTQHDQASDPPPTRADAEMALYIGRAALRWACRRLADT